MQVKTLNLRRYLPGRTRTLIISGLLAAVMVMLIFVAISNVSSDLWSTGRPESSPTAEYNLPTDARINNVSRAKQSDGTQCVYVQYERTSNHQQFLMIRSIQTGSWFTNGTTTEDKIPYR